MATVLLAGTAGQALADDAKGNLLVTPVPLAGTAGPGLADGAKGDLLVTQVQYRPPFALSYDRDTSPVLEPVAFTDTADYDFERFASHAMAIPVELAGISALTVAMGLVDWDWGSSSFHVTSEGFFGRDTKNGGMDKLGHAWSAALISDFFTDRIRENSADPRGAAITGAILSMGVMTAIEIFDGFAGPHGFSPEDIVVDAVGVAFSYVRNTVPWVRDKLDFRMEYFPSGNQNTFAPQSDYSGQKYLLALKLSGFDTFSNTPARFLEVHAGYYARGFTLQEEKDGESIRREVYLGIGINLQELFFGRYADGESRLKTYARSVFEYVQPPYTYATYAPGAYDY